MLLRLLRLPVPLLLILAFSAGCNTENAAPEAPAVSAAGSAGIDPDNSGTQSASASAQEADGSGGSEATSRDEPDVPRPQGMVWVPGGSFQMGSTDGFPDELPIHEVTLDGFWMDETELTVAEFKRFTDATGYVTVAERTPKREDFVGQLSPEEIAAIKDDVLVPGSICFNPKFDRNTFPKGRRPTPAEIYLVWKYEKGANWRHPDGPDSGIEDRMDHPVTHVGWDDCVEYCKWAGRRLPTEAEWEFAARGGLEEKTYPWGDQREPGGQWMTNIWQGEWPFENYVQDGFETTAPVRSYKPNAYGLYEMSGNVWEWCHDWYQAQFYAASPSRNPRGPLESYDPTEPRIPKRIQRGGSFMCNANYCTGYRVAARMKGDPMSGTWHCGFRCVVSESMYEQFRKSPGARIADKPSTSPRAE